MSCCGETIKQVADIGIGYFNLAVGKKYEFSDGRIRICHKCLESTWMSRAEYVSWLVANKIGVIKQFTELEKLPPLPKYSYDKRRNNLFCRLCKCYLPAKASVKDMQCPLNLWPAVKK